MRSDSRQFDPRLEAAKQVFSRLEEQIAVSPTPKFVTGYLAGDLAARSYGCRRPSNLIDAFFDQKLWIPQNLDAVFRDDDGTLHTMSWSRAYSPEIILTHPDYVRRAQTFWVGPRGFLSVKVLSPYDLAVAKIGRWSEADREDLVTLAALEEFDPVAVENLVLEAINDMSGDQRWIRSQLVDALKLINLPLVS